MLKCTRKTSTNRLVSHASSSGIWAPITVCVNAPLPRSPPESAFACVRPLALLALLFAAHGPWASCGWGSWVFIDLSNVAHALMTFFGVCICIWIPSTYLLLAAHVQRIHISRPNRKTNNRLSSERTHTLSIWIGWRLHIRPRYITFARLARQPLPQQQQQQRATDCCITPPFARVVYKTSRRAAAQRAYKIVSCALRAFRVLARTRWFTFAAGGSGGGAACTFSVHRIACIVCARVRRCKWHKHVFTVKPEVFFARTRAYCEGMRALRPAKESLALPRPCEIETCTCRRMGYICPAGRARQKSTLHEHTQCAEYAMNWCL